MNKYMETIMQAVRQNMGLKQFDESRDEEIMSMNKDELFTRVCNWNGFINWGITIKEWVEDIYSVDLHNISK